MNPLGLGHYCSILLRFIHLVNYVVLVILGFCHEYVLAQRE